MKHRRTAFNILTLVLAGSISAQLALADPLPNAWQITDSSTAANTLLYYTNQLTISQQNAATNSTGGFHMTVVARLVDDSGGGPQTMAMAYGFGNKRFLIWWDLDSNGNLTANLDQAGTYTLTTNGAGSALYHTHEIIYNPTNGTARYLFDGQVISNNWLASSFTLPAGEVRWGASASGGRGKMNFNLVTFAITNNVVASYDAGTAGNPAVVPDPTNSVPPWRLFKGAGAGTSFTNISPDMSLLPEATTLAADQFMPGSAQLNGQANPSGSPALVWFEWGPSTNYGNSTPPQPVGAGVALTGFSNSISGLVVGTNYHFRAVVSNAFAVVNGTNQMFNLAAFLPLVTTLVADQLTNTTARLNGQANPSGSPAMAWFEWGATLGYGNVTPPQPVGAGGTLTGFSNSINGLVGGLSYHYRAVASNAFGIVAGNDRSLTLPSFIETAIPDMPGIYDSSVAWGDYDNDGRLDFLITGISFNEDSYYVSKLWRNTGVGFTNVPISGLPGVARGSVAWGDYDNDGRLDFLITGYFDNGADNYVSQLWRNTGSGFSNVTAYVAPGLPGVRDSSVAWGDYDNDGRLDFLITGYFFNETDSYYVSQLWQNTGSGFSNVTASVAPSLPEVRRGSVAWGDYDNDGRLDFLITGSSLNETDDSYLVSQLWRNTGVGFTNVPISGLPGVRDSSVAWGDYDNDGRLDFLITGYFFNETDSYFVSQLWRNTGSGFSNVTASVAPGLQGVEESSVVWGDYDNDGRLDFLLTGIFFNEDSYYVSQLWRNTGVGFTNVPISGLPGVRDSSVAWGDYDNDGRLDFLLTGDAGSTNVSQLWRNNLPLSNAPPAAPTGLSSTVSGSAIMLNWNAPADDHTPAAGLNYNVRIGSIPGGADVLAPMALTSGRRLLPALGKAQTITNAGYHLAPGRKYYWSVQAVDTSFAGSPFAAEQQFTIRPRLINLVRLPNGFFEFYFINQTPVNFEILVSTNVALPAGSWINLGPALHLGGGLYRFTDAGAIGQSSRFYLLREQ